MLKKTKTEIKKCGIKKPQKNFSIAEKYATVNKWKFLYAYECVRTVYEKELSFSRKKIKKEPTEQQQQI